VKQVNDQIFKETTKTVAFLLQEHPLRRDADVMVQELTEEIHKKLKNQIATVMQKVFLSTQSNHILLCFALSVIQYIFSQACFDSRESPKLQKKANNLLWQFH
jgi:hypothetical protein